MNYYCVMYIDNGRVAYVGRNEDDACEAMEPGTCYAKGDTAIEAERKCAREVVRMRRYNGLFPKIGANKQ